MRTPSKMQLISLAFFAITAAIFVLIFTRPKVAISHVSVDSIETANYIVEAENIRAEAADEKDRVAKLKKLTFAKTNSPECRFWKQQQSSKSSKRIEEKIAEFCEVTDPAVTTETVEVSSEK